MDITGKIDQIKETIKNNKDNKYMLLATFKYKSSFTNEERIETKELRPFISSMGDLCYYRKGAKRYGYRLETHNIIALELKQIGTSKTKEQLWNEGWKKVIDKMETSGLWKELKEDYKTGLNIGYEKIQQASKIDGEWGDRSISYEEEQKRKYERIKAIDQRLVTDKGINTNIVWQMGNAPKVKSMYFGWLNDSIKATIKKCLITKQKYSSGRITVKYDVSYEYNPELNKAWYSEEYRGCGNGHYYIAISDSHALFSEDD